METGKQVKRIAGVVFWLLLAVCICGGILTAVLLESGSKDSERYLIGAMICAVSAALGFLCARIAKVLLLGFGQLIEDTAMIRQTNLKKEKESEKGS